MDNQVIVKIGDKEFKFRLKSQKIVELEKLFNKNIFEIFQELSFTTLQRVLWESLEDRTIVTDQYEMMDLLMTKYVLTDIANDLLQKIAVKSGLLKDKDITDTSLEEDAKND